MNTQPSNKVLAWLNKLNGSSESKATAFAKKETKSAGKTHASAWFAKFDKGVEAKVAKKVAVLKTNKW